MATVTSLGFSIFSRYDGSGVRRANRDVNQLQRNLNRSSSGLNNFTGRLGAMATAAAALGPSLLPVGTVLTGIAAGAASLAVTSGAALGVFGLAMNNAVTQTMKMAKAHQHLSPLQTTFVNNVHAMQRAWNGLSFDKPLRVANEGVTALRAGIAKMPAIINAVYPVVKRVADSLRNWATGPGLTRFVNEIIHFGVPALEQLRVAGVHTLTALGIGFRATLPLIRPISEAINRAAGALQRWAEGGGFNRFFATVQKNGPAVGQFFRALAGAVANLSGAMANLGPLSLLTVTGMLRLVAALPQSWLTAIVAGFIAWKAATVGLTVATQVLTIWQARERIGWVATVVIMRSARVAILAWAAAQWVLNAALSANPIGIVIVAVGALVAAIVLIATKTTWFQTAWRATWGFIKHVSASVFSFLTHGLGQLALLLLGPVGALGILALHWRTVWNGIKSVGAAVWHFLVASWRTTVNGLRAAWNAVGGAIRSSFRSVWNGVKGFATANWRAMLSVFKVTFNALKHFGTASWRATSNVFRSVWNGVKRFGTASWHAVLSVFKSTFNTMKRYGTASWTATANVAKRIFGALKNTLHGIWRGILSAARASWNALKAVVSKPVKFVINTVIGKLAKTFNSIAKAVHIGIRVPVPHFATGGHVRGPGGPTADKIPAMLSNGEYVIPAHVVRQHGVGFFDALRKGNSPQRTESMGFNGGNGAGGVMGKALGGWIPDPIKNVGKRVLNALVPGATSLVDTFGSWTKKFISGTLLKGVNAVAGAIPGGGLVHDVAKAGAKRIIKGAADLLFKQNNESGGPIGGTVPKGARLNLLRRALSLTHTPPPGTLTAWLRGLNTLITRESGWNAGAINRTDSNARAGHPSQGLMQTIPSTFNAYRLPGHNNIRNGLDNVIAGIRYIKARYGNITKVQQANANMPPKGYAAGGMVKMVANSFDRGGYLPKGYSIAFNGTGRPEPVGHHLTGGGTTVSFNNCTFGQGSKRDVEDAVVRAITEAERKGRIRRGAR